MNRREIVKLLATAPVVGTFTWTQQEMEDAWRGVGLLQRTAHRAPQYQPKFFVPQEYETVRILVDVIIPRDQRSGSATDAGVPEWMDFILYDSDSEERKTAMRGGIAWLDIECRERFGTDFTDCTDEERRTVLDDIAWPAKAPPALSHGVRFFNDFRDRTASGFWSSKMGVRDLQYMGNTSVPEWTGCSDEQLHRLGVSYDE